MTDYTDLAYIGTIKTPSCPYKAKVEAVKKLYPEFDLDAHLEELIQKAESK